jgi:hypothetical protein
LLTFRRSFARLNAKARFDSGQGTVWRFWCFGCFSEVVGVERTMSGKTQVVSLFRKYVATVTLQGRLVDLPRNARR